uniref:ATP synthase F0 subunit 8 n=1 Tax=Donax trunculus TaxID=40130 RepID=A0A286NT41_9BIVA|nr:ATP synthase F0 subunit 8 [Donax trunculus]ATA66392.1 ATP synthase F0 subunit 8 [Donax trunculus]
MPQMAPLFWSVGLVLIWMVLCSVGVCVWWLLGASRYQFTYK